MSTLPEFTGWARAGLPVITGPAPAGALSLAELAEPEAQAGLLPALTTVAGSQRAGALMLIHYAVYAVTTALVAPLVYDGVTLTAEPPALGVVLDATGGLTAIWLEAPRSVAPAWPVVHLGALAQRLLAPVAAAASRAGRVSRRAASHLTLDALAAGGRRLAGASGREPGPGWVDELIAATEQPTYWPARPILAQPDAGPPVTFYVPHTCCVLHHQPSPHACPTCPVYPDDATRQQRLAEWLSALDDDGFREVTGRARISWTVTETP